MRPDRYPILVNGVKPSLVSCSMCKLPVVNDRTSKYAHKARCFVNDRQVFYPRVTKASSIIGPVLKFEAFREELANA